MTRLFPAYCKAPFAPRHHALWNWAWAIDRDSSPDAFVAIWPRGSAKSTTAHMACAAMGARAARRYILYVSETQDQADQHVSNIGALLESPEMERHHPALASRLLGKYGHSKGWRVNRLRTASGLTIDAIGLDKSARGIKIEDQRPDMLILDDIDQPGDSPEATEKKIQTITRGLLPACTSNVAVLAAQNLVSPGGVFAQLADGRATWLARRMVSGPVPAIEGLEWETHEAPDGRQRAVIVGGAATWEGQDLAACQRFVDTFGISAFRAECQHEVQVRVGGMFNHLSFQRVRWDDLPEMMSVALWVDPAISATDNSDCMGIQAAGLGVDGKIYMLYSWEQRTTPEDALARAIRKGIELRVNHIGIETDQGGDTWESVYRAAAQNLDVPHPPRMVGAKAGATQMSKRERWQQMLADYERGNIIHVTGTHEALEGALSRVPRYKPYDLVDAAWHVWHDLRNTSQGVYL